MLTQTAEMLSSYVQRSQNTVKRIILVAFVFYSFSKMPRTPVNLFYPGPIGKQ